METDKNFKKVNIKKRMATLGIILVMLGAIWIYWGNMDSGRVFCKKLFCPRLSKAINELFQTKNKYLPPNFEAQWVGDNRYFNLVKGKMVGFQEMKKMIMKSIDKKSLDYEVKAILQYQSAHYGSDPQNPNFNVRPIYFVKENERNKDLDFTNSTYREVMKDAIVPVTFQKVLTDYLDKVFTSKMQGMGVAIIVIGSILNVVAIIKP